MGGERRACIVIWGDRVEGEGEGGGTVMVWGVKVG